MALCPSEWNLFVFIYALLIKRSPLFSADCFSIARLFLWCCPCWFWPPALPTLLPPMDCSTWSKSSPARVRRAALCVWVAILSSCLCGAFCISFVLLLLSVRRYTFWCLIELVLRRSTSILSWFSAKIFWAYSELDWFIPCGLWMRSLLLCLFIITFKLNSKLINSIILN